MARQTVITYGLGGYCRSCNPKHLHPDRNIVECHTYEVDDDGNAVEVAPTKD